MVHIGSNLPILLLEISHSDQISVDKVGGRRLGLARLGLFYKVLWMEYD